MIENKELVDQISLAIERKQLPLAHKLIDQAKNENKNITLDIAELESRGLDLDHILYYRDTLGINLIDTRQTEQPVSS